MKAPKLPPASCRYYCHPDMHAMILSLDVIFLAAMAIAVVDLCTWKKRRRRSSRRPLRKHDIPEEA